MTHLLDRHRPTADAAFRVLFSLIFVTAGYGHLVNPDGIVRRLLSAPLGAWLGALLPATPLVVASGVALLLAGLALLVGYRTRLAALLLIGVLVPITLTVQTAPGAMGPLFKNVALFGGLIHFLFAGAGAFSLDARRAPAAAPAGAAHA